MPLSPSIQKFKESFDQTKYAFVYALIHGDSFTGNDRVSGSSATQFNEGRDELKRLVSTYATTGYTADDRAALATLYVLKSLESHEGALTDQAVVNAVNHTFSDQLRGVGEVALLSGVAGFVRRAKNIGQKAIEQGADVGPNGSKMSSDSGSASAAGATARKLPRHARHTASFEAGEGKVISQGESDSEAERSDFSPQLFRESSCPRHLDVAMHEGDLARQYLQLLEFYVSSGDAQNANDCAKMGLAHANNAREHYQAVNDEGVLATEDKREYLVLMARLVAVIKEVGASRTGDAGFGVFNSAPKTKEAAATCANMLKEYNKDDTRNPKWSKVIALANAVAGADVGLRGVVEYEFYVQQQCLAKALFDNESRLAVSGASTDFNTLIAERKDLAQSYVALVGAQCMQPFQGMADEALLDVVNDEHVADFGLFALHEQFLSKLAPGIGKQSEEERARIYGQVLQEMITAVTAPEHDLEQQIRQVAQLRLLVQAYGNTFSEQGDVFPKAALIELLETVNQNIVKNVQQCRVQADFSARAGVLLPERREEKFDKREAVNRQKVLREERSKVFKRVLVGKVSHASSVMQARIKAQLAHLASADKEGAFSDADTEGECKTATRSLADAFATERGMGADTQEIVARLYGLKGVVAYFGAAESLKIEAREARPALIDEKNQIEEAMAAISEAHAALEEKAGNDAGDVFHEPWNSEAYIAALGSMLSNIQKIEAVLSARFDLFEEFGVLKSWTSAEVDRVHAMSALAMDTLADKIVTLEAKGTTPESSRDLAACYKQLRQCVKMNMELTGLSLLLEKEDLSPGAVSAKFSGDYEFKEDGGKQFVADVKELVDELIASGASFEQLQQELAGLCCQCDVFKRMLEPTVHDAAHNDALNAQVQRLKERILSKMEARVECGALEAVIKARVRDTMLEHDYAGIHSAQEVLRLEQQANAERLSQRRRSNASRRMSFASADSFDADNGADTFDVGMKSSGDPAPKPRRRTGATPPSTMFGANGGALRSGAGQSFFASCLKLAGAYNLSRESGVTKAALAEAGLMRHLNGKPNGLVLEAEVERVEFDAHNANAATAHFAEGKGCMQVQQQADGKVSVSFEGDITIKDRITMALKSAEVPATAEMSEQAYNDYLKDAVFDLSRIPRFVLEDVAKRLQAGGGEYRPDDIMNGALDMIAKQAKALGYEKQPPIAILPTAKASVLQMAIQAKRVAATSAARSASSGGDSALSATSRMRRR